MGEVMSHTNGQPKRIGIVGTGPASLLKAWFISKKNPTAEITLIDAGEQAGGAWYSDTSPGGYEIECGCHIWSYAPFAYRFIEQELGVKLQRMTPAPRFIGKWISLPYSTKNTLDTYRTFAKNLLLLRFSALREFNKKPYAHYRIFGKHNLYPKTGSPELIHALLAKIESEKRIQLRLKSRFTELVLDQDGVHFKSADNTLTFDQVYLTYVSNIEQATLFGTTYQPKPRQVDYIHFLIRLKKPLLKKMSYWRLMNDPIVHRITDISYQTAHQENLILVGVKDKSFHGETEDHLLMHVLTLLKKLKLTGDSHFPELIKTHIFPTFYMDRELDRQLKSYPQMISVIHSTDLMYGMHYLLGEEIPHFTQTPK